MLAFLLFGLALPFRQANVGNFVGDFRDDREGLVGNAEN
jgi:hypothetical protein